MQSVWYRSISSIVGADGRAQSFLVGCFLTGLALGYHFWGNIRGVGRPFRAYGNLELILGTYAIFFPQISRFVGVALESVPPSGISDFAATAAIIVPPAFLMGGSIPLLTAGLPSKFAEASLWHTRVYGLNTLGAGAGVLCGGLYLIPWLGLSGTLLVCAALNGGVFALTRFSPDSPSARVKVVAAFDPAGRSISNARLLTLAILSGLMAIGLEIIMMRVLSMAIGPDVTVYPLIVGIFVIGLSIGPLTFRNARGSANTLRSIAGFSLLALLGLFLLVPWLPVWINYLHIQIRAQGFIDSVAYVYAQVLTFALIGAVLIPALVPMGRMLPLLYELLPKNAENFVAVCGRLYFWNTVGCLLGAVGLGHLAFHFLSLPVLFAAIPLLAALGFAVVQWRPGERVKAMCPLLLALLVVVAFPMERASHVVGLYNRREGFSPWDPPRYPGELVFLRDDPLATVAVVKHRASKVMIPPYGSDPFFYTVLINGKPDGATYADSLTTAFVGILPYLHHSARDLRTAVIGYGTGLTAGVLARAQDVAIVEIAEISSALIAAAPIFETQNLQPLSSPKTKLLTQDAFRFLAGRREEFDIIVSEPSGIWVAGSDHLYTEEFYDRVQSALRPDGIFVNWVHLYNNDSAGIARVYQAMRRRFRYSRGYLLSGGVDLAIMASNVPFDAPTIGERFAEPVIHQIGGFFGYTSHVDLNLNLLLPGEAPFNHGELRPQTLDRPSLGYEGARSRFASSRFWPYLDPEFSDEGRLYYSPEKSAAFRRVFSGESDFLRKCALPGVAHRNPICEIVAFGADRFRVWSSQSAGAQEKAMAGRDLRRLGLMVADQSLVEVPISKNQKFIPQPPTPWVYIW